MSHYLGARSLGLGQGMDGDWFQERLAAGDGEEPDGTGAGEYRVLRGGSWIDGTWAARAAYRLIDDPGYRYYFRGFRVLLSVLRQD